MGLTAGLVGLGGSLAGMAGAFGGPQDVQLPPMFNMPNMGAAANNAFAGIGGLSPYTSMASGAMPFAQNTFSNLYNNPYAGAFQGAAGTGAGMGEATAGGQFGAGGVFTGAGVGTIPYAQAIMNMGLDPQNALYNRTAQQLQDQVRAGEAARGIATTPYGAGLENQAMSNFNIDWQNNLLNRATQGAQGAGGLLSTGANLAGAGGQMGYGAGQNFAQFGGLPYSTYAGIGGGQNQAIQSMLGLGQGAQGIANVPISDYFNYINAGNSAGNVANATAGLGLRQQQQGFDQNMMYGNMLGGSMYGLGQDWGGGFGNFNSSPFANWAYNRFSGGQPQYSEPGG